MIIARHGAGSHYVRPDAVYKTGVLQSMTGFVPQQDVMDVAMAFTQGPYLFMQGATAPAGQGVSGLRGPRLGYAQMKSGRVQLMGPMATWWQNLKMRIQAWKATHFGAQKQLSGLGFVPMGPQAWAGPQVVGDPNARMNMLIAMSQKNLPQAIAAQNTAVVTGHWNNHRAPTSY